MFVLKNKVIISALFMFSTNAFSVDEIIPEVPESTELSGSINFKGTITDSSCDIKDQDVELGTHSVTVLKEKGNNTPPVDFNINIENCSLSMDSLVLRMSGQSHQDDNNVFALDAGEQSAKSVGIVIKTKEGDVILPAGSNRNIPIRKDTRDYSLSYVAHYQATGLAEMGKANATVNYTVTYN
ncbi:fimbrial protein [Morganella psychrotolerans]|uniref:Fimbrial-type adhesion domain-containing protein n=1 Tax=Morganella psychrotolerans TaxID=368603 RepID=A0A1B8HF21_9GAMM|nr:fimbrial protein [Morganella psychrotolerans]OBU07660.1 hypothetical protein AYY18_05380 [Morganella psychrotolerans]